VSASAAGALSLSNDRLCNDVTAVLVEVTARHWQALTGGTGPCQDPLRPRSLTRDVRLAPGLRHRLLSDPEVPEGVIANDLSALIVGYILELVLDDLARVRPVALDVRKVR
jgi:hypothetical protein